MGRHLAFVLVVAMACGSKESAGPPPGPPSPPATPPAPAAPPDAGSVDGGSAPAAPVIKGELDPRALQIGTSRTSQCAAERDWDGILFYMLYNRFLPQVVQAGFIAAATHPTATKQDQQGAWLSLARYLVDHGDPKGARAALARLEATEPGKGFSEADRVRVALGEDIAEERTSLRAALDWLRSGRRDVAEQIVAAGLKKADDGYQARELMETLVALGRMDDAHKVVAANPDELDTRSMLLFAAHNAIRERRGVEQAFAALRKQRELEKDDISFLAVVDEGIVFGYAKEVEELRRAISAKPRTRMPEQLYMHLYEQALRVGDKAAADKLRPGFDRLKPPFQRMRPVHDAIYAKNLDEAVRLLQAMPADVISHSLAWAGLQIVWGHHAASGFDPAFDKRLGAAICPPVLTDAKSIPAHVGKTVILHGKVSKDPKPTILGVQVDSEQPDLRGQTAWAFGILGKMEHEVEDYTSIKESRPPGTYYWLDGREHRKAARVHPGPPPTP